MDPFTQGFIKEAIFGLSADEHGIPKEDAERFSRAMNRYFDMNAATEEGVTVPPEQLLAARKDYDEARAKIAPQLRDLYGRRGALLGATVGAVPGGVIGFGMGKDFFHAPFRGAAVGAGLGALGVGALVRHWLRQGAEDEAMSYSQRMTDPARQKSFEEDLLREHVLAAARAENARKMNRSLAKGGYYNDSGE